MGRRGRRNWAGVVPRWRAAARRGWPALAPFAVAALASVICIRLDVFERLFAALRPLEAYEADELAVAVLFFALAGLFHVSRRNWMLRAAIAQTRALERQSHALARTDDLTGLPNRRAFLEALRAAPPGAYLLLVDLDRFSAINDWSGHMLGDKVLVEVAQRLRAMQEGGELIVAARVGGDEFACLCSGDADALAARLIARIATPMMRLPDMPSVRPSVGIVPLAQESQSLRDPLREAEKAMTAAKQAGGGTARRYRELGTVS